MSDNAAFDLKSFFPYQARLYYRAISQTIRKVYHEAYGFSPDEWRTLANLYNSEPMTSKEIVAQASISKVNVSRAIASLEKRNLIERHVDPTDRRRVLLRLNAKGKKIMRDLMPKVIEAEKSILSALNADEYKTLIQLMDKVVMATHYDPSEDSDS